MRQLQLPQATRNSQLEQTNSALTKANPNTADQIFDEHWRTWFTQHDVQRLKALGINTVRIPVRPLFLDQFRVSILTVRRSLATGSSNPSWKRGNTIQRVECIALYVYIPLQISLAITPFTEGRFALAEGSGYCRHSRPSCSPRCLIRQPDVRRAVSPMHQILKNLNLTSVT